MADADRGKFAPGLEDDRFSFMAKADSTHNLSRGPVVRPNILGLV